jgi:hypothetical protein
MLSLVVVARARSATLARSANKTTASGFFELMYSITASVVTTSSGSGSWEVPRKNARILVPGGRLLFLEHVRSADPGIAAKQDRRPFPYPLIGCHPNRDTLREIEASPLTVESVRTGELPKAPKIERPMIAGAARRPGLA